jgi:hypothetical protein
MLIKLESPSSNLGNGGEDPKKIEEVKEYYATKMARAYVNLIRYHDNSPPVFQVFKVVDFKDSNMGGRKTNALYDMFYSSNLSDTLLTYIEQNPNI